MPRVRFTADFDCRLGPHAVRAYKKGMEALVSQECASKAVAEDKAVLLLAADVPRHNVPSPLAGEGQGGGSSQAHEIPITPLPNPPPQGGREPAAASGSAAVRKRRGEKK